MPTTIPNGIHGLMIVTTDLEYTIITTGIMTVLVVLTGRTDHPDHQTDPGRVPFNCQDEQKDKGTYWVNSDFDP